MVSCLRVQVDGHWVQGVLYLTDVPEDAGGINCSPRGPEAVKEWLQQLPPDSKPAEADLVALFKPQPVPGKAGDLVIWHSASHRCFFPPPLLCASARGAVAVTALVWQQA